MKISIITPNYNYSDYISETIESIINQDYKNFEQIIVDDGSTDDSINVIRNYQVLFPDKIKLVCQTNLGQTPALNRGLTEISGDIIGWINSDDLYCEAAFSKVANFFLSNPGTEIVFSDFYVVDINGKFIYKKRFLDFNKYFGIFFGFANIMSSNAVFFRKEVLIKTGNLNNDLKCNMDGEFFARLTKNGNVKKIKEPLAKFRKQTHTKASERYDNWHQIIQKEIKLELIGSYNNLIISNIIPFKYSWIISIWLRIYRVFLRTIKMHYILEYFEKLKYRISG